MDKKNKNLSKVRTSSSSAIVTEVTGPEADRIFEMIHNHNQKQLQNEDPSQWSKYPIWSKLFRDASETDAHLKHPDLMDAIVSCSQVLMSEHGIWALWKPDIRDPLVDWFEYVKSMVNGFKIKIDESELSGDLITKTAPLYVEGINPNAFAIRILGEPVVLFDHRMAWIMTFLSEALCDIQHVNLKYRNSKTSVDETFKEMIVPYNRAMKSILAFVEQGTETLKQAKALSTNFKNDIFSRGIISGALTFVFLHEFGHFLLGHLDLSDSIESSNGIEFYSRNQAEEFGADALAASILFHKPHGMYYPHLVGCLAFFELAAFLEWYCEYLGYPRDIDHPPALQRLDKFKDVLNSVFSFSTWSTSADAKRLTLEAYGGWKDVFLYITEGIKDRLTSGELKPQRILTGGNLVISPKRAIASL